MLQYFRFILSEIHLTRVPKIALTEDSTYACTFSQGQFISFTTVSCFSQHKYAQYSIPIKKKRFHFFTAATDLIFEKFEVVACLYYFYFREHKKKKREILQFLGLYIFLALFNWKLHNVFSFFFLSVAILFRGFFLKKKVCIHIIVFRGLKTEN